MDTKQYFEEYKKAFYKYEVKLEDVDYNIAESYLPFFKFLDSHNNSSIVVIDFCKNNHYYVSDNFYNIFGIDKELLLINNHYEMRKRIHPEDFIINIGSVKAREFLYSVPINERKDYKLTQELRIKNDQNELVRIIIQSSIIELDKNGRFWLNMCMCDLSPIQDLDSPGKIAFWNTKTGDVIFSLEGGKKTLNISRREKEVLSLISDGKRRKEIADDLFISINTVNNHRRNILEKLQVSNSIEAVKLATKYGVI